MNLEPNMNDAEIIILFLQIAKIYQEKKESDFLIEKAKESSENQLLYNSLLDITKVMIKYAK